MNIWHKPDEKPTQHRWIVVKYRAPVKPTCKFVEKDTYISPVCDYAYLDDLLTYYEKELADTKKKLDICVRAFNKIKHDELNTWTTKYKSPLERAIKALEQIKDKDQQ